MPSPQLGEFMGTLVLILLGDGTVAGVLLKGSKAENTGWIAITTGWAIAVMAGVFTAIACGSPDGHLNPAVTVGFAVASGDYSKVVPYSLARLAGAFAGACLVWVHYLPHWRVTGEASSKLGTFATSPAIRNPGANLVSEVIATFVLVLVAGAIGSTRVAVNGPAPALGPYLVGVLVWGSGSPSADRLATRSILHATWDRASRTPCCQLQEKASPTGSTRRFRWPVPS